NYEKKLDDIIKMPNLLTLAAMKAFALGQRAKWKDYADLYFIMKDYHSFKEISQKASRLFGQEFNEKLFRIQLAYFNDVNYDEAIEFLPGFKVDDEKIKKALVEFSLS
ncbi:nucleotidyl transferase AbiEii/AbiGii toxin family protein, partial [Patescibacteria group bacterium]|nr:nucleotidyl transferase AbiEii/AbiGii toxin family protein [Patescibacteria group bacterium]